MYSFKEIVLSDAYRTVGVHYYKSMQFFVMLSLIYVFFFAYSGDLFLFLIISFLWATFGISLFIAMPFFVLHAFLVSKERKTISDKLLMAGHAIAVFATIKFFSLIEGV